MTPYVINPPASPNPKLPLISPSPYSSQYDQPNSPHGNTYHALRFPFSRNRPSALHPAPPSREHDPLPERLYTTRRDASQSPHPIGQNPDRPQGTTRTPTISTATASFNTQPKRHSSNQRQGGWRPATPIANHPPHTGAHQSRNSSTPPSKRTKRHDQPAPSTQPSHTAMN